MLSLNHQQERGLTMKKAFCIALITTIVTLFTFASADTVIRNYLGTWYGGQRFSGNISDYTMTLSSTSDGDIAVNLEAYRIASLNGVMDGFIPEANEAIVLLGNGDDQNLLALLTFYPGRMKLDIVEGNVYGLPEDTVIWFDR